jgi:cellulose synthase/poly-beta-1,6-N-acetylglucosamine synthase-like glycosyltransferase
VFAKQDWLETIGMRHNRWDEGHRILEVWDEKCLTEDADLGIRLTNAGANIQIVYSAEHATQEETPASVEQFVKQRTRWMQGFYEVFRKGDWLGMPKMKQKIVGLYILLNSLLQASLVLFLPVGIFIALTQEIPVPLAIISCIPIYLLLLQMITQLVGIREYAEAYGINLPRGYRLKMILYYYPYQLMLAVSAARAVGRFVRGTNNWEKTAHSGAHRNASPAARPVATA